MYKNFKTTSTKKQEAPKQEPKKSAETSPKSDNDIIEDITALFKVTYKVGEHLVSECASSAMETVGPHVEQVSKTLRTSYSQHMEPHVEALQSLDYEQALKNVTNATVKLSNEVVMPKVHQAVNECMEGVCKIYEEHLKRQNPNIPSITYDIKIPEVQQAREAVHETVKNTGLKEKASLLYEQVKVEFNKNVDMKKITTIMTEYKKYHHDTCERCYGKS
jgi:hypothetical protein